jgi:hypothetical protein
MSNLEMLVGSVVDVFVSRNELFTALDVSNEVKKASPMARHREVRDIVRAVYSTGSMEDYARTPIEVVLEDGSKTEALLYHPLSASWDLEKLYDDQKRAQGSARSTPSAAVNATAVALPVVQAPTVTTTVVPNVVSATVQSITVMPVPPVNTSRQLWYNVFGSNNLFPKF